MPKIIDRTGDRYGRLTVVEQAGVLRKQKAWMCLCDCGTRVIVPNSYLRTGDTRSCGCLKRDETVKRFTAHGHNLGGNVTSPTYNTWRAMRERCRLPSHPQFHNYGGRGITVCDQWKDFANFLADMGERPTGMTLDRIDPNGHYEPANCRWADRLTQARNRRPRKALQCAGEN